MRSWSGSEVKTGSLMVADGRSTPSQRQRRRRFMVFAYRSILTFRRALRGTVAPWRFNPGPSARPQPRGGRVKRGPPSPRTDPSPTEPHAMTRFLVVSATLACLACAPRAGAADLDLVDLDLGKTVQGWNTPKKNQTVSGGRPLSVAKKTYAKGLG